MSPKLRGFLTAFALVLPVVAPPSALPLISAVVSDPLPVLSAVVVEDGTESVVIAALVTARVVAGELPVVATVARDKPVVAGLVVTGEKPVVPPTGCPLVTGELVTGELVTGEVVNRDPVVPGAKAVVKGAEVAPLPPPDELPLVKSVDEPVEEVVLPTFFSTSRICSAELIIH